MSIIGRALPALIETAPASAADTHQHPVFGPDRPAAAVAAIAAMHRAIWEREAAGAGWAPQSYLVRERRAREIRAMYAEYADDFRGH